MAGERDCSGVHGFLCVVRGVQKEALKAIPDRALRGFGRLARASSARFAAPPIPAPEIMKQILKEEKEIYMAEEARIKVSLMEKILYSYRGYQRARWDETSRLDYAREQGLAEGKAEGMKLSQVEIARNMKKLGASADFIQQATSLSAEEIDEL